MQTEGRSRNALPPGTVLNGVYRVEVEVGQGGFGIVYRAQHNELGYRVAIKEYLPAELAVREGRSVHPRSADCREQYQEGLHRFLEEAKQLIQFRAHPSIVSCRDFFRANGTAYLVMDFEEGLPLSELLRIREEEGRPFGEADLRKVMVPLLEGLARVHAAGVLHRDVKPGNILVRREDERPVLIDFGAAKQNFAEHSKSLAPFTEGYAAIEQVGEGKLGPWTDLYAAGAVMWRMVAGGNRPFEPPNPVKVESRTHAVLREAADPLPSARELGRGRFSERVLGAIDKCLELREGDRVQGCGELLGLLREDGKTVPVASEPRPAEEAQSQPAGEAEAKPSGAARKSSRSLKWIAAALAVLTVVAILGWMFSDQFLEMRKESVSVEWVEGLLGESPSKIEERNRQEPCIENPTVRCLIGQAIRVARGINTSQRAEAFESIVGAFGAIASAQAKVGDVDAARQTLAAALAIARSIDDANPRVKALAYIAIVQAKVGHFTDALDTARSIDDVPPCVRAYLRAYVLVPIASAQARAGDVDAARQTLAATLQIAHRLSRASNRARALTNIASAQAKVGDVDAAKWTLAAALEVARGIDYVYSRADALTDIASVQARLGEVDAARQTLAAALAIARSIDKAIRAGALIRIAIAQAKAGDVDAARRTRAAVLAITPRIDKAYQVLFYESRLADIASEQAGAGHFADALAIARSIDSAYLRVEALVRIVRRQTRVRDFDAARQTLAAALEVAHRIDDASSRAGALASIASEQAGVGDVDAARQTLAAAPDPEIAPRISNAFLVFSDLESGPVSIASVQARVGDVDAARQTLSDALAIARRIDDAEFRVRALASIAGEQAKAGDRAAAAYSIGSALEAIDGVVNEDRPGLLRYIAIAQAKIGLVAAAFETAQGLVNDTSLLHQHTMKGIAHARAELGDFENATKAMMAIRDKGDRVAGLAVVAVWLTEIRICPPLFYGNMRLRHPGARLLQLDFF